MRRVAPLVVGLFFLLPGAAEARTIDLLGSTLPRIDGAASPDGAGESVASAGDVNGDGRDDLIVGSTNAGSAYVVYGSLDGDPLDLGAFASDRGFRIDGLAATDVAGVDVAGAGDVNDDGIDDVIVGAPLADRNGRTDSGTAYVVYGSANPVNVDLANLSSGQGFHIDGGADGDHAGVAVGPAGDLNGDGIDDVIVGASLADENFRNASGSSSVIYGSATPVDIDLTELPPRRGIRFGGADANCNYCSTSVDAAGDVNGDGRDDVVLNGRAPASSGRTDAGRAYVIYGSADPTNIDLAALTSGQGFRIEGAAANDLAALEVAGAGDVNGDGRDDVVLSAPGVDSNNGAAYVVYGSANPTDVDLATPTGRAFRMNGSGVDFVNAVDGAGDVNSDGYDDLVIGAANGSVAGRPGAGRAWLVYGSDAPANLPLATLPTEQGFRIDGVATGDVTGSSVAGNLDEDGDGRPDLIIGAPGAERNGLTDSGSTYVVRSEFLPRLEYSSPITGQVGQPLVVSSSFYSRTGTPDFALSGLPAGLSLDPGTGQIRGTPTAPGNSTERITLTDANGRTATNVRFQISPAAAPAPAPAPAGGSPAAPAPGRPAPVTRRPTRKPATKPTGSCAIRLRRGKVNLTCDITYVRGRKSSTKVTITRSGKTYATASGVNRLKLKVRRKMRRGTYRLTVRVRSGTTVVTRRQTVRLR